MTRLAIPPVYCFETLLTGYLLPVLVYNVCQHDQVVAHTSDDDSCYPEECGINEFCCDGDCCSYFARNWFTWMILAILVSMIVITCFCFPRVSSPNDSLETIHYQFISPGQYDVWNTIPYKQQPAIPHYNSFTTEEEHLPEQPYRCERLVQQTPPHFNYPAPSAPPKSP